MYLEIYYFPFILEKTHKINTTIDSIKTDLNRFFLYFFDKKIILNKQEKIDNIFYFLFIDKNTDIYIPNLIFQIEGELSQNQIKELLEIFSSHGEEKFIINYDGFKINNNKFLQLKNVDKFQKQAKTIFEKFIEKYSKNKILDETEKTYIDFRKTYSLFLYLNYILLKTYKGLKNEETTIQNISTELTEHTAHIKLLKNRLQIDKDNLEKNIAIYNQFLEKIIKILKSFDN